jgi:hypothetical protein
MHFSFMFVCALTLVLSLITKNQRVIHASNECRKRQLKCIFLIFLISHPKYSNIHKTNTKSVTAQLLLRNDG